MATEKNIITVITSDVCNDFIAHIKERKSLTKGTLEKYRRDLMAFMDFLPEGENEGERLLDPEVIKVWQQTMLDKGYNTSTISSGTSAINGLLRHIGRWDIMLDIITVSSEESETPSLTRQEYMQLLKCAKEKGKKRAYLLVKLFGSTPISVQNLPLVTVEAVKDGFVTVEGKKENTTIVIPPILQEELLAYSESESITKGSVFRSSVGTPTNRSNLSKEIKSLAFGAKVEPEKCNPRCLKKMYYTIKESIHDKYAALETEEFNRLLKKEQMEIWPEIHKKSKKRSSAVSD